MARKSSVPAEVLDPIVQAYVKFKKNNPDKTANGAAQFEYNGETYTLKKGGNKGKYYAVPAWREARDSRNRDGRKRNQQIKLGSIEQMMVDNTYKEAIKRGLVVDHDIPIAKGGPSNAPWNLKLRTAEVNGAKGDNIGGNYPSEKFISDQEVTTPFMQSNAWHKGANAMRDVVSKAGKRVIGGVVPGAGTAIAASNANTRLNEFKAQPNLQNTAQLAASVVETGANGFGDFALATGIGAPLAAPAEAIANGAGLVDESIDVAEQLMGR